MFPYRDKHQAPTNDKRKRRGSIEAKQLGGCNKMKSLLALALGGMMALAQAGVASAQESTNRVAAKTDWSVFVESNPTECWAVSAPKKTVNTKDGRPVAVRRGDILLFVTYRPSANVKGEVSFTGGYGFRKGSTVSMEIDGKKYELFTDGEWARSGGRGRKALRRLKAGPPKPFQSRPVFGWLCVLRRILYEAQQHLLSLKGSRNEGRSAHHPGSRDHPAQAG